MTGALSASGLDISPEGLKILEQREGVRLHAYQDTRGIWTIGVGHTAAAGLPHPGPGMVITQAQCDEIFRKDVAPCVAAVKAALNRPATQNQFDALVSLAFNIGYNHIRYTSVVRYFNQGMVRAAGNAFLMWANPHVLLGRREAERDQFLRA